MKYSNIASTVASLSISLMAVVISIKAYSYNDEARKIQSYLALQEYRDSFNIELLDQVSLLNCYQYHIDKERHPLSELLISEVNARFDKARYDKENYDVQSADDYLRQLHMYAGQRREHRMNLYARLSKLRAKLESNPNTRELADDRCKGGMFKPH